MLILIDTDGQSERTKISFNGVEQTKLKEFNLSVSAIKKNIKCQIVKEIEGKREFMSYYGDDFKKYDEVSPLKKG